MKSAVFLATVLLLATQAHAQQRPTAKAPPAGPAAVLPPCVCTHIPSLQSELKDVLAKRDAFLRISGFLADRFGASPGPAELTNANAAYSAWLEGQGMRPSTATTPDLCAVLAITPPASPLPRCQAMDQAIAARQDARATFCRSSGGTQPPANRARMEGTSLAAQAQTLADELRRQLGLPPGGIEKDEIAAILAATRACAHQPKPPSAAAPPAPPLPSAAVPPATPSSTPPPATSATRRGLAIAVQAHIDELVLRGRVCDTSVPFTIPTTPNVNLKMTPRNATSGTYAYDGVVPGAGRFYGSGGYTIELAANGTGYLVMDGAGRFYAQNIVGTASKSGAERLRATEIKGGC